ncbi:MAG: hypothetical protein CL484_03225 [Acidobacteria bacterium]|nr:hypothetical protein [Acidobacteriota bacterium]
MKDNHTRLGILKTLTIQDFEAEGFEVGVFELEVTTPTPQLLATGDKPGFIKKEIARHLAHVIQDTGVPSHLWYFETDPKVIKQIPSFPVVLPFGR